MLYSFYYTSSSAINTWKSLKRIECQRYILHVISLTELSVKQMSFKILLYIRLRIIAHIWIKDENIICMVQPLERMLMSEVL